MAYKKKTWKEKLENSKQLPKILEFDPEFPCGRALEKMGAKPGDSVVLASPVEVDAVMQEVPRGQLITLNEICRSLAKKHNVDYCCTLTSGIFVMTAAHAAEEAKSEGAERITPYWRTLKMGGILNEKFPGGAEAHKTMLEQEGHRVIQRGKKFLVQGFENHLVKLK